jgi:uncharacterized small protein (DUF1192 family)
MEEQDLEPRTKRPSLWDLDIMSVEALQDMIVELEAEIVRVRVAIDAKQSWRRQADTFFKS